MQRALIAVYRTRLFAVPSQAGYLIVAYRVMRIAGPEFNVVREY